MYRKLHEELEVAFSDVEGSLDSTTLASLPYLNAVVNESLRLGTPLSGLPRVVPLSGMTIEGRFLPGGTVVSVPAHAQHYDSRNFWPQTDDFVPERWLPEGLGVCSKCEPSALMSFSFGKPCVNADPTIPRTHTPSRTFWLFGQKSCDAGAANCCRTTSIGFRAHLPSKLRCHRLQTRHQEYKDDTVPFPSPRNNQTTTAGAHGWSP